jgi:hypothetical protein
MQILELVVVLHPPRHALLAAGPKDSDQDRPRLQWQPTNRRQLLSGKRRLDGNRATGLEQMKGRVVLSNVVEELEFTGLIVGQWVQSHDPSEVVDLDGIDVAGAPRLCIVPEGGGQRLSDATGASVAQIKVLEVIRRHVLGVVQPEGQVEGLVPQIEDHEDRKPFRVQWLSRLSPTGLRVEYQEPVERLESHVAPQESLFALFEQLPGGVEVPPRPLGQGSFEPHVKVLGLAGEAVLQHHQGIIVAVQAPE